MILMLIIGFSFLGSVGAILLAGSYLLFPERVQRTIIPCLISYATGTLLGAAFLGLLPHAMSQAQPTSVLAVVLAGIIGFFVLEKIVVWRHCHDVDCEAHGRAGSLILVGDAFHNFVDGVAIAAAFVASIPVGIATGLAILAHELPQEVGDFAILLESGYTRRQAILYNILSGLSTLPGALLAYFFLTATQRLTPYVMAISAASFIYIAIADLIPSLHHQSERKQAILQLIFILAGIGTITLLHMGNK
jgi:zinc and cadmium transporter